MRNKTLTASHTSEQTGTIRGGSFLSGLQLRASIRFARTYPHCIDSKGLKTSLVSSFLTIAQCGLFGYKQQPPIIQFTFNYEENENHHIDVL